MLGRALGTADADPLRASTDLADAASLLARVLVALGEPYEARGWAAFAYAAQRRLYGPADARTVVATATLAAVLHRVGSDARAVHLYREVVDHLTGADGPDSLRVLAAQADLATVEHARGDCAAARTRLADAWQRHREVYGDGEVAGIKMLARLGAMERDCGRFTEAQQHFDLARRLSRDHLPPEHPMAAQIAALAGAGADPVHVCRPAGPPPDPDDGAGGAGNGVDGGESDGGNGRHPGHRGHDGDGRHDGDLGEEDHDRDGDRSDDADRIDEGYHDRDGDRGHDADHSHDGDRGAPGVAAVPVQGRPEGGHPGGGIAPGVVAVPAWNRTGPGPGRQGAGGNGDDRLAGPDRWADEPVGDGAAAVSGRAGDASYHDTGDDDMDAYGWYDHDPTWDTPTPVPIDRYPAAAPGHPDADPDEPWWPPDPATAPSPVPDDPRERDGTAQRDTLPERTDDRQRGAIAVRPAGGRLPVRLYRPPAARSRRLTVAVVAGLAVVTLGTAAAVTGLVMSGDEEPTAGDRPAASAAASAPAGVPAPTPTRGPAATASGPAPPTRVTLRDARDSVTLAWAYPKGSEGPVLISGGRSGQQQRAFQELPAGSDTYVVYGLNERADYCFTIAVVYSVDTVAAAESVCTRRTGASPAG